jgi:hypothetical protein
MYKMPSIHMYTDFFTNRTFSEPNHAISERPKKSVSPKNIRFAKSTVQFGKSLVREKVEMRTVVTEKSETPYHIFKNTDHSIRTSTPFDACVELVWLF